MGNLQPSLLMLMLSAMAAAGNILAVSAPTSRYSRDIEEQRSHDEYKRYDNTIPAAPVQGQASSCSLDLSDELLGGVKAACMTGPLDKKHCCPVLAAWLMAARAKIALHPPLQQEPGMPLLPDDSLVCIASLKAALAARGIFISTPTPTSSPLNSTEPCDVVTCFCGIHLSLLTSQSCPLPFDSTIAQNSTSVAANDSSHSQPRLPHIVQHNAKHNYGHTENPNTENHSLNQYHYSPNHHSYSHNQKKTKLNQQILGHNQHDSSLDYKQNEFIRSDLSIKTGKGVPLEPLQNETGITSGSSTPPPPAANSPAEAPAGSANLLQRLAANCTDHSYRGCTRCLKTLTKEMRTAAAKSIIRGSSGKAKECELIGLMWLLEVNKTLYIPTVSAVVRALMYNSDHPNITKCSLDTDNMPLALDYAELLSTSTSINLISHLFIPPSLITLLISLHVGVMPHFHLLL